MSKKQVVESMSDWSGVLKDFFRQINDGSINLRQIQAFLEHKNPFKTVDSVIDWQEFYSDVFGIEVDFSNLHIPEKQKGFDRLIVVAQGMTSQRLYDKCKELFLCWKWTDNSLDEIVGHSDRVAEDNAYAIWVRDRVEADKEIKNLSANDLKKKGIPGITLEERLVYELKYFKETGKHLDIKNVTLCAGSRYSDGGVSSVSWYCIGELRIYRYSSGHSIFTVRSRQTVF